MDWRSYFFISPSTELALEKEFRLEKANPYHDPKTGRFTSAWGRKGFSHAGVVPTGTRKDGKAFHELGSEERMSIVRRAIATTMHRGSGKIVGITASDITAAVSQATGSLQGKELSKSVLSTMKDLQDKGHISISKKTMSLKQEGGHWVFSDAKTGKPILNPITGKPAKGRDIAGAKDIATRDVHSITLTNAGSRLASKEGGDLGLRQTLSNTRPTKFDPVPGGTAEQALKIRQQTFPTSKLGPQGRVHASEPTAPEMLKTSGPGSLTEVHKGIKWYDATSSARANVGAMTGNKELLESVRLGKGNPKTPAMETAKELGIHAVDKPYYAILNQKANGGHALTKADFNIGNLLKNKDADGEMKGIKKVVKAVDTPRLYGGRPQATIKSTTNEILVQAGLSGPKATRQATPDEKIQAKALATKLVQNFDSTPIAKFEAHFKTLAKEMPDNFVYTNPINGFRMTMQKHEIYNERKSFIVTDAKGNKSEMAISVRTPGEPSRIKSSGSAMPLFVQSFDAAVKDEVMTKMKNPYSKHDAFGIKSDIQLGSLKRIVAGAYQKINKANPIKDFADQMKAQLKAQIGQTLIPRTKPRKGTKPKPPKVYTQADYYKQVANIDKIVNNFPGFSNGKPPSVTIPTDTGHLEYEP